MNPNELSARLRKIASKIDSSKRPSKDAVLKDLRVVLAAVGGRAPMDASTFDPNTYFYGSFEEFYRVMSHEVGFADKVEFTGSDALWKAMMELGTTNWWPAESTNPGKIPASQIIDLAVEIEKESGGTGAKARAYATNNYRAFEDEYWPMIKAGTYGA
jgi:hypothetical protein